MRHRVSIVRARLNVYHPYHPGRVPALLEMRTTGSGTTGAWGGQGGNTPAMRVGLAVRPMGPDILLERGLQAAVDKAQVPKPEPVPRQPAPRPLPATPTIPQQEDISQAPDMEFRL